MSSSDKCPAGRARDGRPSRRSDVGIEIEYHSGDVDLVARPKALGLERVEHADAPQAPFEVGQRLLVVEVVARHETVDPDARDREAPVAGPPDGVAPPRGGPEDSVLGELDVELRLTGRD